MSVLYRKASEESAATTLDGTEFWAAVQAGGDVKITAAQVLAYINSLTSTTQRPEAGATWVVGTGSITLPVNDVPLYVKRARTIIGVSLLTIGGPGSCIVDIWKTAIGSYPPTIANSICGSAKPTISSGITYVDTTLTGWTTAVSAGDTLMLHLASSSSFSLVACKLFFTEV